MNAEGTLNITSHRATCCWLATQQLWVIPGIPFGDERLGFTTEAAAPDLLLASCDPQSSSVSPSLNAQHILSFDY